jgi:prepilin-type N-terminal cleavage/methylation domain-containing protein
VVLQRIRGLDRRGFTATELIVVMAIIGVIAAISIPNLITYYQTSTLKAGAEELATALNRGRQLAITQNRSICFQVVGNQYQYTYGCGGPVVWLPGAGAGGFFTLANNVLIANGGVNPVFNYLGAATTAGTLTVTYVNQSGTPGASRNVVVSASGRIQIQ